MKIKRIKIDNLIFFICALLPIIIALFVAIANMGNTSGISFDSFYNSFSNSLSDMDNPFYEPLYNFVTMFGTQFGNYTDLVCYLVSWLGFIYILKLVFTAIMFIPKFACNMLEKVGDKLD